MYKQIIPDELFERIGRNLHTVRNAHKETLEAAAAAVGTTHPTLSKIENGRYPGLSIVTLIDLCNHYKVTLQQIMDLELTQIFNYSQNNQAGSNSFTQTNEFAAGYLLHIEYLQNELNNYRRKCGESFEDIAQPIKSSKTQRNNK